MEQPIDFEAHYRKIAELKEESKESAESSLKKIKESLADILRTYDEIKNNPRFFEFYHEWLDDTDYECYQAFEVDQINTDNFRAVADSLEKIIPDAVATIGVGDQQKNDLTFDFRGYIGSHFGTVLDQIEDTKKILEAFSRRKDDTKTV